MGWGQERETEHQTHDGTEQMRAAQSTDDRAAAPSISCSDSARPRPERNSTARPHPHLSRWGWEVRLLLPGTREGGGEGDRGRALGSLLSATSRLPTTRPASSGLCFPAQAATSRRETKGRNQRRQGGAGSSKQVRPTQRRWRRKKDRQRRTDSGRKGRRSREER